MSFKLTIEQGNGRGQSFDFSEAKIVIGRGEDCDVILTETGVSRRHASIIAQGREHRLEDHGSSNGTLLNGQRLSGTQSLSDGDTIQIAGVVFRFEGLDSTATGVSATALGGALDDEDRTNPGAAAPVLPGSAPTPRSPGSELVSKLILAVVVLVLAGVAGVFALNFFGGEEVGEECPDIIGIRDVPGVSFGLGGDYNCGPRLRLGFYAEPQSKLLFHYSPYKVEAGAVDILLNGQRVAAAAHAPNLTPQPATLELDNSLLKLGSEGNQEINVIEFVNRRGEPWGVKDLELEVIELAGANLEDGLQAFSLAERRYRERNIAASNLYDAWKYFREARSKFEGLAEKPIEYQATVEMSLQARRDLDKLCRDKLFEAQQHSVYHRYDEANAALRFIIMAFPGDLHPCKATAEELLNWD